MANVSSVTEGFFVTAQEGFTTTTSGSVAEAATTVGLNSVSGYTNGDHVALVIDPTDATKKQVFTGTVDTAGVQITDVVWTEGDNQSHTAGATVVDYETATAWALQKKGWEVEHNQDGTHGDVNAASLSLTGNLDVVDGAAIMDSNNNQLVIFQETASAVNQFDITNAATGNGPTLSATGSDANIDINITPKGTGKTIPSENFFRGRYQSNTTNSAPTGLTVQFGWGYMTGTGTDDMGEAVTFPAAFSTAPVVFVSFLGASLVASGAPDSPDDFTTAITSEAVVASSSSILATGFTARFNRSDAAIMANTVNWGYSWIAIGAV